MRLELVHPMIVHFPIALILCVLAVDSIAAVRGQPILGRGAAATAAAGLAASAAVFALLAYVFGDQAYGLAAQAPGAPLGLLEMHEAFGTFTAFAIAAWGVLRGILWWRARDHGAGTRAATIAVDAVLVAAVLATAWYGGELVYSHGVAVLAPG